MPINQPSRAVLDRPSAEVLGHSAAVVPERGRSGGGAVAAFSTRSGLSLTIALLGFFVITLDAVVVNVALPSIRYDLGAGMTGLQWVVDAYTLLFAALLLSAGSLSDRFGARQTLGAGLALFVVASAACGLAPTVEVLIVARFFRARRSR